MNLFLDMGHLLCATPDLCGNDDKPLAAVQSMECAQGDSMPCKAVIITTAGDCEYTIVLTKK
ncbi:MAG: hypothetical protein LBJ14_06140 [Desulfarculales bacterium]|jgi:hypothetical protein|nr:hypothetical protein [Desulfarculales bacterium]